MAAGGYRHALLCEDLDLYWRLRDRAKLVNLEDALGDYRVHGSSSGASPRNGRILSNFTQLMAVSERRRRQRRPDLTFEAGAWKAYRQAGTLEAMLHLSQRGTTEAEKAYLGVAVPMKYLQWLEFRRYDPDPEDCAACRRAFRGTRDLPPADQAELRRVQSLIGARLLRAGKIGRARALLAPSLLPLAAARAASGRC